MQTKRPAIAGVGHHIEIAASAGAVWAVIADLEHWSTWNPLYTSASGVPVVGSRLEMTVVLEGMKPQQASATVVTAQPGALFEYAIIKMGGLLKSFRYVEIEVLDAERCRVANFEIMSGLVGNLLLRLAGEKVRKGLQAMNEALKHKVEGLPG